MTRVEQYDDDRPGTAEQGTGKRGERAKKATVNRALREFIARREQERLLELFGKLDWDDEYDYKQERMRR